MTVIFRLYKVSLFLQIRNNNFSCLFCRHTFIFFHYIRHVPLPGADNGSVKLNEDDSRSGIWRLYDLVRQRVSEAGEGKLQFYDSGTGEELLTVRFTVTDGSAEVEKTEGTEETDGGPDTGVEG